MTDNLATWQKYFVVLGLLVCSRFPRVQDFTAHGFPIAFFVCGGPLSWVGP